MAKSSRNLGIPYQMRFDTHEQKAAFERVVQDYDKRLSVNNALMKWVDHCIEQHWIPGYERKPKDTQAKESKTISTGEQAKLDKLAKKPLDI